jgi:hypothetical protein
MRGRLWFEASGPVCLPVVGFARLIHRPGRAVWRTFGPRRLRRQSESALVATEGDVVVHHGHYSTTAGGASDRPTE